MHVETWTSHAATPSTWFQQTTNLNTSVVAAKHLTNARRTNDDKEAENDEEADNDIHGAPRTKAKLHSFQ